MRVGQRVTFKSLVENSDRIFSGTVRSFEHDPAGWATVHVDGEDCWATVSRKRLIIAQPPGSKSAKAGGAAPAMAVAVA